jgi:quercetin dioxygenase-like cupin family protein
LRSRRTSSIQGVQRDGDQKLGQTLIVTAGCGWVQRWSGAIEEIRPGDVVWIPPGEKHWHGATPITAMTHIAIQEKKDGKVVDWMEQVSDEQYQG